MQFRIMLRGQPVDVVAVEKMLYQADPAAMVDLDNGLEQLRVSTSLDDDELLVLINQSGTFSPADLERVPSECCGGCGG